LQATLPHISVYVIPTSWPIIGMPIICALEVEKTILLKALYNVNCNKLH